MVSVSMSTQDEQQQVNQAPVYICKVRVMLEARHQWRNLHHDSYQWVVCLDRTKLGRNIIIGP
jgi:hypothetical protein